MIIDFIGSTNEAILIGSCLLNDFSLYLGGSYLDLEHEMKHFVTKNNHEIKHYNHSEKREREKSVI